MNSLLTEELLGIADPRSLTAQTRGQLAKVVEKSVRDFVGIRTTDEEYAKLLDLYPNSCHTDYLCYNRARQGTQDGGWSPCYRYLVLQSRRECNYL